MAKLYQLQKSGFSDFHFHCPGCKCDHGVWITPHDGNGIIYSFNGSLDKPTIHPSILIQWVKLPEVLEKDEKGNYVMGTDGRFKGSKDVRCHSFIRDGMIEFLGDCTHELAGQTVELPDIK